jgi:hypothetical protein
MYSKEWVRICCAIGMLPPYIQKQDWEKHGFVFDTDIPRSLLYVYLCNARHLKEEFDIVNATVTLATKFNVEPNAALVFATRLMSRNSGHGYLPNTNSHYYYSYNASPCLSIYQVKLRDIIGLRKFMTSPQKYDTKLERVGANMAITSAINDTSIADINVNVQDMTDDVLHKAVIEFAAADQYVKKYLERKAA